LADFSQRGLARPDWRGTALADQVKSLDWKTRQAERKGQATLVEMAEIRAKIKALLKLA